LAISTVLFATVTFSRFMGVEPYLGLKPLKPIYAAQAGRRTALPNRIASVRASQSNPGEHRQGNKLAPTADSWKEIVDRYRAQWITPGQKATLDAEHYRGIATGKSFREIGAALGQIVKGWERGR
jgi:hypothetical protein